jgi:hypothetical protein
MCDITLHLVDVVVDVSKRTNTLPDCLSSRVKELVLCPTLVLSKHTPAAILDSPKSQRTQLQQHSGTTPSGAGPIALPKGPFQVGMKENSKMMSLPPHPLTLRMRSLLPLLFRKHQVMQLSGLPQDKHARPMKMSFSCSCR